MIQFPERTWTPAEEQKTGKVSRTVVPEKTWRDIGVLPPQTLRMFQGINTLDRFSIEKTYATESKNLTGAGFPALSVRPGYTQLGSALGGRILGLGVWKDQQLHVVVNGQWRKWDGSTWEVLASGLDTDEYWSFCNFQGNLSDISLLGVNGVQARYYDGSSVQTLSNVPSGAKYIDQHDNRVYVSKGNSVHFSALRKPQDWTTVDDAGEIVVETNDGEEINGLKAGSKHLLVFKPSSVHELWGTGPLNYRMDTVATDIGLLSNQCVVVVQGIPYWMDTNGIYYYGGARPRKDFSLPVKSYIEGINPDHKHKSSAGTDGKNLYIAIPHGANDPNTILEFDTVFQTWYVWKDFSPLHFAHMGSKLFIGDVSGRVLQIGGTTDNGQPIEWNWVSAPFGGGSLAQRLQWYRMWYVADVPLGSSMNVYLSRKAEGNDDWTLVKSIPADSLHAGRIIIPVETVANANWVRVKFEGTGPMKITEFDYQQRELPMY